MKQSSLSLCFLFFGGAAVDLMNRVACTTERTSAGGATASKPRRRKTKGVIVNSVGYKYATPNGVLKNYELS